MKQVRKLFFRGTAWFVLATFVYVTIASPYAEASIWEERKSSYNKLKKDREPLLLAQATAPGIGNLPLENLNSERAPSAQSHAFLQAVLNRYAKSNSVPAWLGQKITPYGTVERTWLPQPDFTNFSELKTPLVIHVQDAHGIDNAQKNIAGLIAQLQLAGVRIVGVEGASGPMTHLAAWNDYPDPQSLQKTAGFLLKEGLLSGVERAGLGPNAKGLVFFGLEEKAEYFKQVCAFTETLDLQERSSALLKEKETLLQGQKNKYFTPELRALDQAQKEREKGSLGMGEWILKLTLFQEPHPSEYPNLAKYRQAYTIEKSLDFKQIKKDQTNLLKNLSANLPAQELQALVEESLAYRLGYIRYSDFYAALKKRAVQARVFMTPEMERYISYLALTQGIQSEPLFRELEKFTDQVWFALTDKNKDLRAIYELDRNLNIMGKAAAFKLTPEEFSSFKQRLPALLHLEPGLEPVLIRVNRFSEQSNIRSKIFIEKLTRRMGTAPQTALLIAGGYHSQEIESSLKKQNIAFITIRPNLESAASGPQPDPLAAFHRELLPLEKAFLPEKVTLAPQSGLDPMEPGPIQEAVVPALATISVSLTLARHPQLTKQVAQFMQKMGVRMDEEAIHIEPKGEHFQIDARFNNHPLRLYLLAPNTLSSRPQKLEAANLLQIPVNELLDFAQLEETPNSPTLVFVKQKNLPQALLRLHEEMSQFMSPKQEVTLTAEGNALGSIKGLLQFKGLSPEDRLQLENARI